MHILAFCLSITKLFYHHLYLRNEARFSCLLRNNLLWGEMLLEIEKAETLREGYSATKTRTRTLFLLYHSNKNSLKLFVFLYRRRKLVILWRPSYIKLQRKFCVLKRNMFLYFLSKVQVFVLYTNYFLLHINNLKLCCLHVYSNHRKF